MADVGIHWLDQHTYGAGVILWPGLGVHRLHVIGLACPLAQLGNPLAECGSPLAHRPTHLGDRRSTGSVLSSGAASGRACGIACGTGWPAGMPVGMPLEECLEACLTKAGGNACGCAPSDFCNYKCLGKNVITFPRFCQKKEPDRCRNLAQEGCF